MYVLSGLDGLSDAMHEGRSTAGLGTARWLRARLSVCNTSYAELDPRLFRYNSKHGWCPDCVGTGVQLNREQRKALDDSVQERDTSGREQTFAEPDVEGVSTIHLHGTPSQPGGAAGASADSPSPMWRK